ncbi:hypothetical protein WR25_26644 [Diploscapter pachys]|uniref:Mitochondrial mRNA-processing protein COX24 C-terminal domain-containing protein n=1 Tax=Diploscapter pachys TaxID=2018661 RepID=A0A2A2KHX5_9BILA|nr:hypothetical protein WR25_26644 [Diploscapter pachys]
MNRSVAELTRRLARFSLSAQRQRTIPLSSSFPPSSSSVHKDPAHLSSFSSVVKSNAAGNDRPTQSFELPGLTNPARIYTFPMFERPAIVDPAPFLNQILEKMDPLPETAPLKAPPYSTSVAIQLMPRLITIRRKKMKKHKRRKRYDRDFFKYQKYHREKKLRAEREFLQRMKGHLAELAAFNPQKYVDNTINMAKKEWSEELSPSGRKIYPHWSRFMTLEELYGVEKNDYIDKKAGLPAEEDKAKVAKLKEQYENLYRKA